MTQAKIYLGPAPCEEEPVQLGHPDYHDLGLRECRRYIAAIRKVCGNEPDNARLRVVKEPHDFGSFYDVIVEFDPADPQAVAYAEKVDEHGPVTWEQAGMAAPPVPAAKRGRA